MHYRFNLLNQEQTAGTEDIDASDDAAVLLEAEERLRRGISLSVEIWQGHRRVGQASLSPEGEMVVAGMPWEGEGTRVFRLWAMLALPAHMEEIVTPDGQRSIRRRNTIESARRFTVGDHAFIIRPCSNSAFADSVSNSIGAFEAG
jgi:hypothetical protein